MHCKQPLVLLTTTASGGNNETLTPCSCNRGAVVQIWKLEIKYLTLAASSEAEGAMKPPTAPTRKPL